MKRIRIVDLDSTIADDRWRMWLIDPHMEDGADKYHYYHLHCHDDPVINRWIVDECLHDVVFLTARPERMRKETKAWLDRHELSHLALLMRSDEDERHSMVMKRDVVQLLKKQFEIEKAFDDRWDIVQMYNECEIEGVFVKWE